MATFVDIIDLGTHKIALFNCAFRTKLRIDQRSLIERIKNLRRQSLDVSEEMKGLKALKEANK